MPVSAWDADTSVSFDRAASFYDQTRGLPPAVAEEVAAGLCRVAGLQPGARLLELGVGTGRLALPLAERGLTVFGVDLSREMLGVLRCKASSCHVLQGDIVALPFVDSCFAAVLAVHVLHLVGGWRLALREAVRVLQPRGAFLLAWNQWDEASPPAEVRQRWREIVAELKGQVGRPGEQDKDRIVATLQELGLQLVGQSTVAAWHRPSSPAEVARSIDARTFSDSWQVSDDVLQRSLELLWTWIEQRYADPEAQVEAAQSFQAVLLRCPPADWSRG